MTSLERIARNSGECRVHVLNPRLGIGNDDGFPRLLNRGNQKRRIGQAETGAAGRDMVWSDPGVV